MEYRLAPVSLVRTRNPASLHGWRRLSASARVMGPWNHLQGKEPGEPFGATRGHSEFPQTSTPSTPPRRRSLTAACPGRGRGPPAPLRCQARPPPAGASPSSRASSFGGGAAAGAGPPSPPWVPPEASQQRALQPLAVRKSTGQAVFSNFFKKLFF